MGLFDRFKGRKNDSLVGDLAVDDGWGLVPEASVASFVAEADRKIKQQDVEDWEAIIRAAKDRDENVIEVPRFEEPEEEADWEAMIAKAKAQPAVASPARPPAPRPPAPPRATGSRPPELAPAASHVPVPRPPSRSKAVEEDWDAVIANAKARTSAVRPPAVDEWAEAIKRAKTRAA